MWLTALSLQLWRSYTQASLVLKDPLGSVPSYPPPPIPTPALRSTHQL